MVNRLLLAIPLLLFNNVWHFSTQAFSLNCRPATRPRTDLGAASSHDPAEPRRGRVVIVGGGIGGISSAYDAKHVLGKDHDVILVSDKPNFSFVPSNPWVAIRKRQPHDIQIPLEKVLQRHGVEFVQDAVVGLKPGSNKLQLASGKQLEYDYLIIATGPRLAFDRISGLKEAGVSICTTPHAVHTADAIDKLVQEPGPVVVGATQGASCFGPAYEFLFLLHYELNRRGGNALLEKCPMTYITPEPELGHLGLDGAGESKKILKQLCKDKGIEAMCQVRTTKVTKDTVFVEEIDDSGKVVAKHALPSKLTMLIPPFEGLDCWKKVPGLTDSKGLIVVDEHQRSPSFPNIFAVGAAVSMPQIFKTIIPVGIPKTGYLIESQGTAAVKNIKTLLDWKMGSIDSTDTKDIAKPPPLNNRSLNNALCITDFGTDGAIFVALPQVPPRLHDWTIHSKMATLAKIAFEKYFLHKVEVGDTDPYYEKHLLHLIGVERTIKDHVEREKAQV